MGSVDVGLNQNQQQVSTAPGAGPMMGPQPVAEQAAQVPAVQPTDGPVDFEDLRLLTRVGAGLVVLGTAELLCRLREYQRELEANPERLRPEKEIDDTTAADLARYFLIGSLLWGQERLTRAAVNGFIFSYTSTRSALDMADRLTDNRLLRPFRRPVDRAGDALLRGVLMRISEGRYEEQNSRILAREIVANVIDDFIDHISDNPQLEALVSSQLQQQTTGLAGTVIRNSREVTVDADSLLETFARRLLRRAPRTELPESPIAGKPQTMYQSVTQGDDMTEKEQSA